MATKRECNRKCSQQCWMTPEERSAVRLAIDMVQGLFKGDWIENLRRLGQRLEVK